MLIHVTFNFLVLISVNSFSKNCNDYHFQNSLSCINTVNHHTMLKLECLMLLYCNCCFYNSSKFLLHCLFVFSYNKVFTIVYICGCNTFITFKIKLNVLCYTKTLLGMKLLAPKILFVEYFLHVNIYLIYLKWVCMCVLNSYSLLHSCCCYLQILIACILPSQ